MPHSRERGDDLPSIASIAALGNALLSSGRLSL
jgi:hypothetical protein